MIVTFSCSEDLVLTGTDSATCMDTGQWIPDPRKVKCKGMYTMCRLSGFYLGFEIWGGGGGGGGGEAIVDNVAVGEAIVDNVAVGGGCERGMCSLLCEV